MSNTALPREAELRTWASRGIEVEGDVLVTRMPRLQAVIASGESLLSRRSGAGKTSNIATLLTSKCR